MQPKRQKGPFLPDLNQAISENGCRKRSSIGYIYMSNSNPMNSPEMIDLKSQIFDAIADHYMGLLRSKGYDIPNSACDSQKKLLLYLGAAARFVESRKRTVHNSAVFSCPADRQMGLAAIIQKMERGEALRPHQSKRVDKPDYNDGIFNHWGIQHFHLETTVDCNGWVTRTGELLFAVVRDEDVFCLDVKDHTAWSDQDLVQIIHDDFRHLIENRKIDAVDLATTFSNDELRTLHGRNVNVSLKMKDGTIYGPLGGVVASGKRLEDVRTVDQLRIWCSSLAAKLNEELVGEFGASIRNNPSYIGQKLRIDRLDIFIQDGNLNVREPKTRESLNVALPQLKMI